MSKISEIFTYLRNCPQLSALMGIGGEEAAENMIIFPQGSSQLYNIRERKDVVGGYDGDLIPYPSVYEDYQINCYKAFDNRDVSKTEQNINVLSYNEVESVCEWIMAQNELGNLPEITGKQVISIECFPFVPQIRYVNAEQNIICYFITVRIRYVNTCKGRAICFD